MKNLIFALAIAASFATSSVYAQAKNFAGVSMGGNLNLISTTTEISLGSSGLNGIGQEATNVSVQAAYGLIISDVALLSVGGTYNLSDIDAGKITSGATTNTIKFQNAVALYVEPGLMLNDKNLGYAKISYNRATVKAEAGESVTQDVSGTGFGFGIRTLLSKNAYLQIEVNRIQYASARFDGSTTDFKSASTAGSLGLGYKF